MWTNTVTFEFIVWLSGCSEAGPDPDPELMEPIQPSVSVSPHGRFERLQEDPDYISHFTRAPVHKGQRRLSCFLLRWKEKKNNMQEGQSGDLEGSRQDLALDSYEELKATVDLLLLTPPVTHLHAGTCRPAWACSPWVCWSAGSFAHLLTWNHLILRRTAQTCWRSCCSRSQPRRSTLCTSKSAIWQNRLEKGRISSLFDLRRSLLFLMVKSIGARDERKRGPQ